MSANAKIAVVVITGSVLVVLGWQLKRKKRMEEAEMKSRKEEQMLEAQMLHVKNECEELMDNEFFYEGIVNDVLAQLAMEGSLQLRIERNADGKIDYGSRAAPDALLKVDKWYATPTALLPAAIDVSFFEMARKVSAGAFIRVLDRATTNYKWLETTFRQLAKIDSWTRNMLQLAKLDDGGKRIRCHIIRADYMQDESTGRVVNIEVNPFAASLAGPAVAATKAHRRLLAKIVGCSHTLDRVLPRNNAVQGIAKALAQALILYAEQYKVSKSKLAILFVTVAEEDNECCHRHIESSLYDSHGIVSLRYTIPQLIKRRLASDNKTLLNTDNRLVLPMASTGDRVSFEVAVSYFRLCRWERYGSDGWKIRSELAHCTAVEVPSAAAHLAGLKRGQVEWSSRSGLTALGMSEADIKEVTAVAVPQFALDDQNAALRARSTVDIDTRRGFVAKAARDGYLDMAHVFGRKRVLDLAAEAAKKPGPARGLVVQALARPKARPSLVLTTNRHKMNSNNVQKEDTPIAQVRSSVPELGIFVTALSAAVSNQNDANYRNQSGEAVGHLVRSKHADTDDGGLCRGNAIVDSPLLFRSETSVPHFTIARP